jgi:hypothetical protein
MKEVPSVEFGLNILKTNNENKSDQDKEDIFNYDNTEN